jgi:hypothetical protein
LKKCLWLLPFFLATVIFSAGQAQTPNEISKKDSLCDDKSAKILILGSYHMDNPGKDEINIEASDVLTPQKQQEINEVLDKLARFKPTKIAIESAYRSPNWTTRYEKFLAGEHQLGRNEIEQIGFQLAKRLHHTKIYPVDFPMWMNGLMPSEIEEPKVKPQPKPATEAKKAEPQAALPPYLAKHEQLMRNGTVLQILQNLNSEEYIKADHAIYMNLMLPKEDIAIYGSTDLLTNWYKRNFRIFTNIARITEFPEDRILLIIGSGHLKILRDLAIDSPYFCLADTEFYLK